MAEYAQNTSMGIGDSTEDAELERISEAERINARSELDGRKKTSSPSAPVSPTGGRKKSRKFSKELALRIVELASQGKSVNQISSDLGVSVYALNNWKGAQVGFKEAIQASRKVADELVVASLFQRAVGWQQPAIKIHYDKDQSRFVTYEYTERFPADTTACIFWLKNRQRTQWSDSYDYNGDIKATVGTGEIEALASRLEQILKDTHASSATAAMDRSAEVAASPVTGLLPNEAPC